MKHTLACWRKPVRSIIKCIEIYIIYICILSCITSGKELLDADKVNELFRTLNTPEKLNSFLYDFKYQLDQDGEPRTKRPALFLKDHKGDCKDFSYFAFKCGQFNGINCRIYRLSDNKKWKAHAVCIWKINDVFYPLDNVSSNYKEPHQFTKFQDIKEWYRKQFDWIHIDECKPCILLPYMLINLPNWDCLFNRNERFEGI